MATIDPTPEYVAHLLSMTHSPNQLSSRGFNLKPLSPAELLKKARCDMCNKRPQKPRSRKPKACPENSSLKDDGLTAVVPVANSLGKFDAPPTGESPLSASTGIAGINTTVSMSNAYQAIIGNNSSDTRGTRHTASHPPTTKLPRGQKIQGKCYNCSCVGHKAVDCPKERRALPNMEQNLPKPPCQWHPGARRRNIYLCCRAPISTPGCHSSPTHTLPTTLTPALTTRFQVHPTPPSTISPPTKALAVAIDCEMGTALDGEPELIRVTVLDYFTGTILLDSLVWPDIPMQHFNTRYSGVTVPQMWAAKRTQTCLFGVEAARREVWRHVGAETVVVGHDVKNDLGALRWAHGVVVDSMLVEAAAREKAASQWDIEEEKENGDATASSGGSAPGAAARAASQGVEVPKGPGLSLKDVSKLRLGRIIQKRTHDSFEDALASRDIVHHHAVTSIG